MDSSEGVSAANATEQFGSVRSMVSLLTIGEVSERSGVAPSALRFYESRGLISSVRTTGNQRRFRRDVLRRVAIIQAANQVGLSLQEIGDCLAVLPVDRMARAQHGADVAERLRPLVDQRLADIEELRQELGGASPGGAQR